MKLTLPITLAIKRHSILPSSYTPPVSISSRQRILSITYHTPQYFNQFKSSLHNSVTNLPQAHRYTNGLTRCPMSSRRYPYINKFIPPPVGTNFFINSSIKFHIENCLSLFPPLELSLDLRPLNRPQACTGNDNIKHADSYHKSNTLEIVWKGHSNIYLIFFLRITRPSLRYFT